MPRVPIRSLPCILLVLPFMLSRRITRTHGSSWIYGMLQEKISLPNGPCMHCHVDDGSGNVCHAFFSSSAEHARTYTRNIASGYISYLLGPNEKGNSPKSHRASEPLFFLSGMQVVARKLVRLSSASVAHQLTQT